MNLRDQNKYKLVHILRGSIPWDEFEERTCPHCKNFPINRCNQPQNKIVNVVGIFVKRYNRLCSASICLDFEKCDKIKTKSKK